MVYQSIDWWENVKIRITEFSIKHGIRIARDKRIKLRARQAQFSNSNADQIDHLLSSEVEGAFIRSRARYLEEDEKPSAFFFRQESRRAKQKVIRSMRNNSGDIVTEDEDILDLFHKFYSNLFAHEDHVDVNLQSNCINCLRSTVDPTDKFDLDRPISFEEVKFALSKTANNKSPGVDGIPYELYRCFIDVMGNDLVEVYNDLFLKGALSVSQRTAVISLIPKKGDLLSPSHWRPICSKIHSIILWLERFTKHLVGSNFQFNVSFFLFGIAQIEFSRVVFNRLYGLFCALLNSSFGNRGVFMIFNLFCILVILSFRLLLKK